MILLVYTQYTNQFKSNGYEFCLLYDPKMASYGLLSIRKRSILLFMHYLKIKIPLVTTFFDNKIHMHNILKHQKFANHAEKNSQLRFTFTFHNNLGYPPKTSQYLHTSID